MPDSGANQYWQAVTDVYFVLMVACGVVGMGGIELSRPFNAGLN